MKLLNWFVTTILGYILLLVGISVLIEIPIWYFTPLKFLPMILGNIFMAIILSIIKIKKFKSFI